MQWGFVHWQSKLKRLVLQSVASLCTLWLHSSNGKIIGRCIHTLSMQYEKSNPNRMCVQMSWVYFAYDVLCLTCYTLHAVDFYFPWVIQYLLASPLPPAPCLVAAASLFGRSDNFGHHFNIILVSFLGPVGIIWRRLGTSVGHLGEKFTPWEAMYWM